MLHTKIKIQSTHVVEKNYLSYCRSKTNWDNAQKGQTVTLSTRARNKSLANMWVSSHDELFKKKTVEIKKKRPGGLKIFPLFNYMF
jgi:hypothetical protein